MDLEELRAFLAVTEAGSVLGAATVLGIPRATLRRRIDALEARIGMPLLQRNAKGVAITDAGALLARRGQALLDSSAALLQAVRVVGREDDGPLRLRFVVGLPPEVLTAALALARTLLPRLQLVIRICDDPLAGPLEDCDALVYFGDRPAPTGWVSHPIQRVPLRLLASPAYLARHGRPERLADLSAHSLVCWSPVGAAPALPLRGGGSLPLRPMLLSNDAHALRQQVRAGVGVGLLVDGDLGRVAAGDELQPVLAAEVEGSVALQLAVPEALTRAARITALIEIVRRLSSP